MHSAPPAQSGWYDDPENEGLKRFWDGEAWSEHTAPRDSIPTASATVKSGLSNKAKGWIIAGSVFGGLVVLSSIAGAMSRGPAPTIGPPAAVSSEVSPSPSDSTAVSAAPTVEAEPLEVFDLAYFKSSAFGNLDDYDKDLDDMVVTVDEGGFWRLLSNSVELSFNLGQLQGTEPPASIAAQWELELNRLDATITSISDAVSADDSNAIRNAIEASRAQAATVRSLVDQAS